MENIESFFKTEDLSYCDCYFCSGFGSGYGDGYSSGYGDGSGFGSGFGSCFGSGFGYGADSGSGDGSGDGYSYGFDGILQFNGCHVFVIDGIQTVIKKTIGDFAKGFIINKDLTTQSCYIAKSGNTFAHGKTIHEAHKALMGKMLEEMPVEERIERFFNEFKGSRKYKAIEYYKWHHILTGSCKFGRDQFAKEHSIDLENDEFTVKEFVELTKNSYGGDIIKEIERRISDV